MKKLNLLFASLALALGACSSDEPTIDNPETQDTPKTPDAYTPIDLSRSEADMVEAQNRFALRLYNAIVEKTDVPDNTNVVISPLSVGMCLSMIANGASGDLYDSLMEIFGASDINALNEFNERLLSVLPGMNPSQAVLNFNNGLWENSAMGGVGKSFRSVLESCYNADAFTADFGNTDIKTDVNTWVEKNTGGLIKDLLSDPVDSRQAMVLANTVDFKGNWTFKFNRSATVSEAFHGTDGSVKCKVMMMKQKQQLGYYKYIPGMKILLLPYGNGSYLMEVIVPDENVSPWSLLANGNDNFLNDYRNYPIGDANVDLSMPRFDISFKNVISNALESLGVDIIGSDLKQINEQMDGFSLLHATHIVNDEEGTQFAAATSTDVVWAYHSPYLKVELNRPFGFIIREASSGAILFIGHIANPAKN